MRRHSASTEWIAGGAAVVVAAVWAGFIVSRLWTTAPIVSDGAGLLAEEQRAHLERMHALLLSDYDLDYRVELASDVGPLNRWSNARFAELEVGSRSEAGRGLLLVLDAGQDAVRLEVGRSLEGVFPDAFIAYVEQRQMVPYFRAGQIGDGVLAATELLVTRIQNARARSGWDSELWVAGSSGAGARTRARLAAGRDDSFASGPGIPARGTPLDTVTAYLAAMSDRNGNPDLDLYTSDTRTMLAGRVITPAQMDNVARSYRKCSPERARLTADGAHAVIRYPPDARDCAPFLLELEDGLWRLDFATAARAIRFGRSNAWRWLPEQAGPYGFAFADWTFDRHGFPRAG